MEETSTEVTDVRNAPGQDRTLFAVTAYEYSRTPGTLLLTNSRTRTFIECLHSADL